MNMFDSEVESIEAFKKSIYPKKFICFYEQGFYEIIDTRRGFCGEDKLHWSEPICTTQEKYGANLIVNALNAFDPYDGY